MQNNENTDSLLTGSIAFLFAAVVPIIQCTMRRIVRLGRRGAWTHYALDTRTLIVVEDKFY